MVTIASLLLNSSSFIHSSSACQIHTPGGLLPIITNQERCLMHKHNNQGREQEKNTEKSMGKNGTSDDDNQTGDLSIDPDLPTDEDIRVMAFDDNMSGLAEAVKLDTDQRSVIKENDITIFSSVSTEKDKVKTGKNRVKN